MAHADAQQPAQRGVKRTHSLQDVDVPRRVHDMFGVEDIPQSPDSACVAAKVVYNAMKEAFQVDEIEPIKLHKLLFFAQAIAAAVFDVPLIDEDFEAWPFGPVVAGLYDAGYNGWPARPLLKPEIAVPSTMLMRCVEAAVAAHGSDSVSEIKRKSHMNSVWLKHKGQPWQHKRMPFEEIRVWFSQPKVLMDEVLPYLLSFDDARVGSTLDMLEQDASLRPSIDITAQEVRDRNADVVVWPGQSPLSALIVAHCRPDTLYDIMATQMKEGTEDYANLLARLAGLGDLVASVRLADLIDMEQPVIEPKFAPETETEKYAFGTYYFLTGNHDAATRMWKNCTHSAAKVAVAATGPSAAEALNTLGDGAQPYAAYKVKDLDALRVLKETSVEAKYRYGLLAARRGAADAFETLKQLALEGHESVCTSLFNLFPFEKHFSQEDLVALAETTQGGAVALYCYYRNRKDAENASLALKRVDNLNRLQQLGEGEDDEEALAELYTNLTYIACPD